MDPQSVAFVPHSESWRLYNDLLRLQQVQADHADRLLRLERRQDDDARMKSVWGGASPFPSVLSGTPQQAPIHHLKGFDDDDDDEPANLIGSLHLDPEEEPRRMGATSRANSVRFDESANQGHWAHASRSSIDFLPRSTSSLGGLGMTERTSSHKSDGRASSVHSVRSAASGRASLDTGYASPVDAPIVAPGLLILGPVPAIVRCWLNTNFKHDALLYAAVSTASYKSQIDLRLVQHLGMEDCIAEGTSGAKLITLPIYFAEAVPHPISTRSSSPAPQVPSVTVEFNVVGSMQMDKAIQVAIGSDVLRSHSADVLFSSNSMTLFDDDECKLSIPLVRPENEATFNSLSISCSPPFQESIPQDQPPLNGLGQTESSVSQQPQHEKEEGEEEEAAKSPHETILQPLEKPATQDEPSRSRQQSISTTEKARVDIQEPVVSTPTSSQSASTPSIWSNWRRETLMNNSDPDVPKTKESGYQRRDAGIKVLRPTRNVSRTFSGGSAASSLGDNRSRYFDEGKKRGLADTVAGEEKTLSRRATGDSQTEMAAGKTRVNPAGGASAFSWLHSSKV